MENNLSEEEILDDINFCLEGEYITREHYEAIQGLLDLYNKEKETSHFLQSELDRANAKILEEKEKNKELYEDNQKQWAERCKLAMDLDYVDENYINKDKIREFIKEETKEGTYNFKTISSDRLLEFLEEE